MQTVVLTIHLILALALIGLVLMQKSEGGGLGIGGGGGASTAGRSAANALTKLTWILAVGFLITSLTLTIMAARDSAGSSVLDRVDGPAANETDTLLPPSLGDDLLPPSSTDAPALPPKADE